MLRVTTEFAPIIEECPIWIGPKSFAPVPIIAFFPIDGYPSCRSFVNRRPSTTPLRIKTSSLIIDPVPITIPDGWGNWTWRPIVAPFSIWIPCKEKFRILIIFGTIGIRYFLRSSDILNKIITRNPVSVADSLKNPKMVEPVWPQAEISSFILIR